MSRDFLNAVKERDIEHVSVNVDNMDKKTLKLALSTVRNTIRNFKSKDSDYSDDIERLNEISDIINGA